MKNEIHPKAAVCAKEIRPFLQLDDYRDYSQRHVEALINRICFGEKCRWTQDREEGYWNSGCGEAFALEVCGPSENKMKFCPYCGKGLVVDDGKAD